MRRASSKISKPNGSKQGTASNDHVLSKEALEGLFVGERSASAKLAVDDVRKALLDLQPMKLSEFQQLKNNINGVVVEEFITTTNLWGFTDKEKSKALGLKSVKELRALISKPDKINKTQMNRISCVFCIDADLKALLCGNETVNGWLRRTDKKRLLLSNDKTPLGKILSGKSNDIEELRSYLAGVRYH